MTQQEYEQVKARILEEQKAERRAKAQERKRVNDAAWAIFDETEQEYLPKLVVKYSRKTGNYDCAEECKWKIHQVSRSALSIIGERNRKTAYLNGRVEEANLVLRRLLDELLA